MCLPSEDIDAPDNLNNSDPICIGNTLPAGSMSRLLGDSATFLGCDTSMTLPCGPVPLLGSFLRSTCALSCGVDRDVDSVTAGAVVVRVIVGWGSAEAVAAGVVFEASDDCRDLFWRLGGFCIALLSLRETAELGSESAFLFIPVSRTGRGCVGRGGGGGDTKVVCSCAPIDAEVEVVLGIC